MITKRTVIDKPQNFIQIAAMIDSSADAREFCFFDIETTGLDAYSTGLYLIGFTIYDGNNVILTQLFAEKYEDEKLLISSLLREIMNCTYIVHFNGSTFDIPYLQKKGADLSAFKSFDIYRELKPYKEFLGLSSMTQKSLEKFCGISRKDKYDGGELIEFYLKYLALSKIEKLSSPTVKKLPKVYSSGLPYLDNISSQCLLDDMFLHNFEDVTGMLTIGLLLAVKHPSVLFDSPNIEIKESSDISVDMSLSNCFSNVFISNLIVEKFYNNYLKNNFSDDYTIEKYSSEVCDANYVLLGLRILLKGYTGTLRLFFENYKDYYYLPAEDTVIPKSIGKYMDSSSRKNATEDNCYMSHEGSFIPITLRPEGKNAVGLPSGIHFLRKNFNSRLIYISSEEFKRISSEETKRNDDDLMKSLLLRLLIM